jgi:hypothetical protein
VLAISLRSVIQEAAADQNIKKLSGNIQSFADLVKPENLALLEKSHQGAFAFLAFYPAADAAITSYVHAGTLASDSGRHILALFTLDEEARWPTPVTPESFGSWLTLDAAVHPAYELVRLLFEPTAPPPLPGIAFFDTFTAETHVVYATLAGLADAGAARQSLRQLFGLAERVWQEAQRKPRGAFADRLGAALAKDGLPYVRTGRISMREWLVKSMRFLEEHASDIVTLISAAIP